MKGKTVKRALALALAMAVSLCGCALKPQELMELLETVRPGSGQSAPEEDAAPPPCPDKGGTPAPDSAPPQATAQPRPSATEEGRQSLQWLREKIGFEGTMFGVAYLGYVGGLFEEGFETGFPQWLRETNAAMLNEYPFIAEIDPERIAGGAGHLYCIVPVDENATLAINRVYWDGGTQREEVTEVLYRSEAGDPVLLFANLDDIPALADTHVTITDSRGNVCDWYPTLDEEGHIVPCVTEDGVYSSADFTEYGWKDTPEALAPWLADDFEGMTAAGLAGWESDDMSCWLTQAPVEPSGRNADFLLVFYPGDEAGGTVDLYWTYEGALSPEGVWSGFWSIETVMEGPSDVTITLFHLGGESGIAGGTTYIEETYPCLMSPSGLELLIGPGKNGVRLPFMPPDEEVCLLTRDESYTLYPAGSSD